MKNRQSEAPGMPPQGDAGTIEQAEQAPLSNQNNTSANTHQHQQQPGGAVWRYAQCPRCHIVSTRDALRQLSPGPEWAELRGSFWRCTWCDYAAPCSRFALVQKALRAGAR